MSAILPDTAVARTVMVLIPTIRVPFHDQEILAPALFKLPPLKLIATRATPISNVKPFLIYKCSNDVLR